MTTSQRIRPSGNYSPAAITGDTVVSAGMTPRVDGELAVSACVGSDERAGDITVEHAANLAAQSVQRAVDACRQVLPQHGRLVRPISLTVYVRSRPDFTRHSEVADGASSALSATFGGQVPARAAVGVCSLPGGAPVEVVLTAEWTRGPVGDPA
jgi:enamine deaminase RidA (YjgF/YER057c/UK114 family)